MLGHEITKRYAAEGLPDGTIDLTFTGSAGQSFGAFLPSGVTLRLEGDANDYLAKGLSGGRIVVRPDPAAMFDAHDQVIAGNVIAYGATAGEMFINGGVGQRFCVRNSGVTAVVETVGDHACEYMTGGRVIVLGAVGRNFAAGMSGGVAYVLDQDGQFVPRCNKEMVGLTVLSLVEDAEEAKAVRAMIERHVHWTQSAHGKRILDRWAEYLPRFVRVLPHDYRRVVEAQRKMRDKGLSVEEAEMAAFEQNARDEARVGGN
jgi:glutamate synthase (ferredoxin)